MTPSIRMHDSSGRHLQLSPRTRISVAAIVVFVLVALRVWSMMPERWPEILTVLFLVVGGFVKIVSVLTKAADAIDDNKRTMEAFRGEFRDAMREQREGLHLQELKVEGIERDVLEMKAHLRAHGLLEPLHHYPTPGEKAASGS
jgi:hypothetical protein